MCKRSCEFDFTKSEGFDNLGHTELEQATLVRKGLTKMKIEIFRIHLCGRTRYIARFATDIYLHT